MKKKYSVIEVTDEGVFRDNVEYSQFDLINTQGVHARDLFSLDIGGDSTPMNPDHETVHPMILPRADSIVISMGTIKAIVARTKVIVFEPEKPLVKQWATNFLKSVTSVYRSIQELDGDEVLSFELFCIEDVLKSTCDVYERRVILFSPLVDNLMQQMDKEADAYAGIDRLLPIRDALQQFEIDVKETQDCLTTLLANDDDMAQLMLSENTVRGSVDITRHVVVELLVESYAARLTHTLNNVVYQQQKVKSRQEVAEFSVQMQRNRILRMNLHCGIAGVSIGLATIVSSMYGMNIPLPEVSTAIFGSQFGTLFAIATIGPSIVYSLSFRYLRGTGFKQLEERRGEQKAMLKALFSDIGAVDYAVRESFNVMNHEDEEEEEEEEEEEDGDDEVKEEKVQKSDEIEGIYNSLYIASGHSDRRQHKIGHLSASEGHSSKLGDTAFTIDTTTTNAKKSNTYDTSRDGNAADIESIDNMAISLSSGSSVDSRVDESYSKEISRSVEGIERDERSWTRGKRTADQQRAIWSKSAGRKVTKEDFARYMRAARGGKEVDQRAVDLFFDILDSDNDGVLSMEESDISNEMKVGQEGQQAVDASSHVQDGDGDVKPERLTEFSKKMRKAF